MTGFCCEIMHASCIIEFQQDTCMQGYPPPVADRRINQVRPNDDHMQAVQNHHGMFVRACAVHDVARIRACWWQQQLPRWCTEAGGRLILMLYNTCVRQLCCKWPAVQALDRPNQAVSGSSGSGGSTQTGRSECLRRYLMMEPSWSSRPSMPLCSTAPHARNPSDTAEMEHLSPAAPHAWRVVKAHNYTVIRMHARAAAVRCMEGHASPAQQRLQQGSCKAPRRAFLRRSTMMAVALMSVPRMSMTCPGKRV